MGTVIVSIILVLIVACIIFSMIKAKRNGRHPSCGGHCASCPGACHCNSQKNRCYIE